MNDGFVKTYRQVQEHWTSERPEWYQAWSYIVQDTAWKDTENVNRGEVNLTEVYRKLSKYFTKDSWRYFVKRLSNDGMIEICETKNLGSKAGFSQIAFVVNYAKYHDQKPEKAHENSSKQQDAALNAAKTQLRRSTKRSTFPSVTEKQTPLNAAKKIERRAKDAALNAVYKEVFIPKEVKEEKLSLAEAFFQNLHPTASVPCIEELEKKNSSANWALSFWGEESLSALLGEAARIASGPRLGFVWADLILGTRQSNVKPKSVSREVENVPPPPIFEIGQKIKTPKGTIQEVLDTTRVFVVTLEGSYYPKDCQAVAN